MDPLSPVEHDALEAARTRWIEEAVPDVPDVSEVGWLAHREFAVHQRAGEGEGTERDRYAAEELQEALADLDAAAVPKRSHDGIGKWWSLASRVRILILERDRALSAQRAGEPTPSGDDEVERAAKAYHESARDTYMRVAGYGTIQPWSELPESSRAVEREHALAALDAARQPKGEQ